MSAGVLATRDVETSATLKMFLLSPSNHTTQNAHCLQIYPQSRPMFSIAVSPPSKDCHGPSCRYKMSL